MSPENIYYVFCALVIVFSYCYVGLFVTVMMFILIALLTCGLKIYPYKKT